MNKNDVRKRSLSVMRNLKENAKSSRVFPPQQRLWMELSLEQLPDTHKSQALISNMEGKS